MCTSYLHNIPKVIFSLIQPKPGGVGGSLFAMTRSGGERGRTCQSSSIKTPKEWKTPPRSLQYPGSVPTRTGATWQTRAEAQHRVRGPSGRRGGAQAAGGPARPGQSLGEPARGSPGRQSDRGPSRARNLEKRQENLGWAGRGPQVSQGRVRRARQRGGAREPGKAPGGARRRGRGGARRPGCGLGAEAARGAASGRAGPYRAAAAGRRGAPTPAWPPEPRVPAPRRPSPAAPPRAASLALQVARRRIGVTDRKFPPTGAKWQGEDLSPRWRGRCGRGGRAEPGAAPGAARRASPRACRVRSPHSAARGSSAGAVGIGCRAAGAVAGVGEKARPELPRSPESLNTFVWMSERGDTREPEAPSARGVFEAPEWELNPRCTCGLGPRSGQQRVAVHARWVLTDQWSSVFPSIS